MDPDQLGGGADAPPGSKQDKPLRCSHEPLTLIKEMLYTSAVVLTRGPQTWDPYRAPYLGNCLLQSNLLSIPISGLRLWFHLR